MISKVIIGKSFAGVCAYVCKDERRATVLFAEGVRGYDYKLMAADFELQQELRPSLSKAVFHGILSFYPGEDLSDEVMANIAREYLEKAGIVNTQYVIAKHTDKDHLHLHVIANLVNNDGGVIKDNWIGLRGKKIAQQLTIKYNLAQALKKNLALTHFEQLNAKEAGKYLIYQGIVDVLPACKNFDDLKRQLEKINISFEFKYKGQTNEVQGISFKSGNYKYKGSEIDRNFSFKNLDKTLEKQWLRAQLKANVPLRIIMEQKAQRTTSSLPVTNKQTDKVLDVLLKPHESNEPLPNQWDMQKIAKRKVRRLRI